MVVGVVSCESMATLQQSSEAKAISLSCCVDGDSDCQIVSVDSPIVIETDSDSSSYSLSDGDSVADVTAVEQVSSDEDFVDLQM